MNKKIRALDTRFKSDIGDSETIRQYLYQLLRSVWRENEEFSGKRPFGNSGWQYDVYKALVDGGYVSAEFSDSGEILHIDEREADEFVLDLIHYVFYPDKLYIEDANQ